MWHQLANNKWYDNKCETVCTSEQNTLREHSCSGTKWWYWRRREKAGHRGWVGGERGAAGLFSVHRVDMVARQWDIVTWYFQHVWPSGGDDLCAIALVVWWGDVQDWVGQGRDVWVRDGGSRIGQMVAHQDQRIEWQWAYCLCFSSGVRVAPRNELDADPDPWSPTEACTRILWMHLAQCRAATQGKSTSLAPSG